MASRIALLITAAMAVAVVGALLPATASAEVYVVEWMEEVDYDAWASSKQFRVGDQIEFAYPQGYHNVVSVDQASYEACTLPSKDYNWYIKNSGNDYYTFTVEGPMFFICGFKGHCLNGMKLRVNVLPQ